MSRFPPLAFPSFHGFRTHNKPPDRLIISLSCCECGVLCVNACFAGCSVVSGGFCRRFRKNGGSICGGPW